MQEGRNTDAVSKATDYYITEDPVRLQRRFFIEFYRGIPQSIQDNFKLYDTDGRKAAGARTSDLCDSSRLFVKIMFGYFQAAALLGCYSAYSCNSLLTFRGKLSVP